MMHASLVEDRPETTHRVKRGESLGKIARRHGVTVQDLRAWNNLKSNTIMPGQNLRIAASGTSSESTGSGYITYKVKRGDTLSTIAQRHRGATVNGIKSDNNLASNQIQVGMTLKINTM